MLFCFQLTSADGSLAHTLDRQMTFEPFHEQIVIMIFALLCVIASLPFFPEQAS